MDKNCKQKNDMGFCLFRGYNHELCPHCDGTGFAPVKRRLGDKIGLIAARRIRFRRDEDYRIGLYTSDDNGHGRRFNRESSRRHSDKF